LRGVATLRIPQKDYGVVSQVIRSGNILKQDYDENDVVIEVELSKVLLAQLKKYCVNVAN